MANALTRKAEDTNDAIELLTSLTASKREKYADLATIIASPVNKLSSDNISLVTYLRDNTRIGRLLGQCMIGGLTREKTGTGVALLGTHYCW